VGKKKKKKKKKKKQKKREREREKGKTLRIGNETHKTTKRSEIHGERYT